jgi:hypothetical protein
LRRPRAEPAKTEPSAGHAGEQRGGERQALVVRLEAASMPFKAGHVADWPSRTGCEPLPMLDGVEPLITRPLACRTDFWHPTTSSVERSASPGEVSGAAVMVPGDSAGGEPGRRLPGRVGRSAELRWAVEQARAGQEPGGRPSSSPASSWTGHDGIDAGPCTARTCGCQKVGRGW